MAISAPRLASRSANARPSPRPAPVTSATLPCRVRAVSSFGMVSSPEQALQSGRASIIKAPDLQAGRFRHRATIKQGARFVAYSNTQLFINGKWRPSQSGKTIPVLNPATEEQIGTVAHADRADLDEA